VRKLEERKVITRTKHKVITVLINNRDWECFFLARVIMAVIHKVRVIRGALSESRYQ